MHISEKVDIILEMIEERIGEVPAEKIPSYREAVIAGLAKIDSQIITEKIFENRKQ